MGLPRSRSAALALVLGLIVGLAGCGGSNSPPYNPTPVITGIFPASATAGGGAFTLNLSGTGLISKSVAFWNNSSRPTTFNPTTTELAVSISAQDIARAGVAQVTVFNPTPGGGASSATFFTINAASVPARRETADRAGGDFPQVVSISAAGGPADGGSALPAISADGRFVAFFSQATNLVARGPAGNVFLRDTCLGTSDCAPQTFAVDLAPDGRAPDGASSASVSLSVDGRFVAFASTATNLEPGRIGNGERRSSSVFVRDTCLSPNSPAICIPSTIEISLDPAGNHPSGASHSPSLSSDGRFVAFRSAADNLAASGLVNAAGIYVRDTCAGSTAPKSCVPTTFAVPAANRRATEDQPDGQLGISANGRYVVFASTTDRVGSPSGNPSTQVFLADMCLGPSAPEGCRPSTIAISATLDGSFGKGASQNPSVSADGRFVAFESRAADLVDEPLGRAQSIYLRDTCLGASAPAGCVSSTTLIPGAASVVPASADTASPWISPTGRYITFIAAQASDDQNRAGRRSGSLYVYDTCFGRAGDCTSGVYPISASGDGLRPSPLIVDAFARVPLTSDDRFAAFSTAYTVPASPLSGAGDVLLAVTPF
jgi:hypothetical protein